MEPYLWLSPVVKRYNLNTIPMVRALCFSYIILSLVALGLIRVLGGDHYAFDPLSLPSADWPVPLAAVLVMVMGVHLISVRAIKLLPSMTQCANDIKHWLGNISGNQVLLIALASGIGEELFFRGWLMNEIGLFLSSLIFGLVHLPPNRNWRLWPLFAFIIGLVLGTLCLWTNTLLFAVAAHAGINYLNLKFALSLKLPDKE